MHSVRDTTRLNLTVRSPCCVCACTLQDYLGPRYTVGATLFAAPNAGDATFASAYGRKVNARRFKFLNDLIPQVPCAPNMIGCADALVPTATTRNKGLWQYTSIPGNLLLLPSGMPQQAEAWSQLTDIYPCEMGRFLRATHTCSYNCYMSQYVPDNNTLCLLWATDGGSSPAGTYCYDFPVTSGPCTPTSCDRAPLKGESVGYPVRSTRLTQCVYPYKL